MFDNLVLLKSGGHLVYNGTLGPTSISPLTGDPYNTAGDLVKYFQNLAPNLPLMHPGSNPADFMLERVGPSREETDPEYVDYVGAYLGSQMCKDIEESLRDVRPGRPLDMQTRYAVPLYKQLYMSTERWYTDYWRNVGYNFARSVLIIIIALVFSLSVRGIRISEIKTQAQLQSFNGAIFASLFFTAALQVCTCARGIHVRVHIVYESMRVHIVYESMRVHRFMHTCACASLYAYMCVCIFICIHVRIVYGPHTQPQVAEF
jgi:hypothetical protein